jgi:hypothetical protein
VALAAEEEPNETYFLTDFLHEPGEPNKTCVYKRSGSWWCSAKSVSSSRLLQNHDS